MKTSRLLQLSAVALVTLAPHTMATNGYFTHGVGSHNKALAGAGLAAPSQAIDAANNPASALLVEDQSNAGISIFSPQRSYTASTSLAQGNMGAFSITTQGTLDSDSEYFPIPHYARKWTLDDTSALAFTFYGRGGMNTDWQGGSATFDPDGGMGPAPVMTMAGTFGMGDAGVNLNQAFVELAYAKRLTDTVVVGISPVVVLQAFEAKGLEAFTGYTKTFASNLPMGAPAGSLTGNGHDTSYGVGLKVGVNWQLSDGLTFAFAHQTEVKMSEFDDYSDLFAEAGGFDIPASTRIGLSVQASPNLSIHVDGESIGYSDIPSVGNSGANVYQCPTAGQGFNAIDNCLGGNNGAGFGWDDMSVIKIGLTWSSDRLPGTTFRAGVSLGDQPIQPGEVLFNILAPGVMEQHLTFGIARELGNGKEWGATFMYAPEESVKGSSLFDPTQTIELSMKQFEVEFYYTW